MCSPPFKSLPEKILSLPNCKFLLARLSRVFALFKRALCRRLIGESYRMCRLPACRSGLGPSQVTSQIHSARTPLGMRCPAVPRRSSQLSRFKIHFALSSASLLFVFHSNCLRKLSMSLDPFDQCLSRRKGRCVVKRSATKIGLGSAKKRQRPFQWRFPTVV